VRVSYGNLCLLLKNKVLLGGETSLPSRWWEGGVLLRLALSGPTNNMSKVIICPIIQGFGLCHTGLFLAKVPTFCISSPAFRVQGFTVARPTLYVNAVNYESGDPWLWRTGISY
jgi:hypothetical protein